MASAGAVPRATGNLGDAELGVEGGVGMWADLGAESCCGGAVGGAVDRAW